MLFRKITFGLIYEDGKEEEGPIFPEAPRGRAVVVNISMIFCDLEILRAAPVKHIIPR